MTPTVIARPEAADFFDLDLRVVTAGAGSDPSPDSQTATIYTRCCTPTTTRISCSCVTCHTQATYLCTQTSCGVYPC